MIIEPQEAVPHGPDRLEGSGELRPSGILNVIAGEGDSLDHGKKDHGKKWNSLDLAGDIARLYAIADTTEDLILDRDLDSGSFWWNQRAFDLVAFNRKEASQDPDWWIERIHPDDHAHCIHEFREFLSGSSNSTQWEFRLRIWDGSYRFFRSSVRAIRWNGSRVVRFVMVMKDITGQRRAEQERDRLFQLSPDLLAVLGLDGRFQSLNKAWETAVGLPVEALLTGRMADVFHPEDRSMALRQLRNLVNGKPLEEFECRCIRPGDSETASMPHSANAHTPRWYRFCITPELSKGVIHLSGKEITFAKEAAEAALAAKNATEALEKDNSILLAGMSHEIRTPLNGVLGLTRLLLDMDLAGQQREYAETIETTSQHLLNLVNSILDHSRTNANKIELETMEFDPGAAVEDAVVLLARAAQTKGVELLCYRAPDVPSKVTGDLSRFRQVLLNLIGNAIKFTKKGEVIVTIQAGHTDPGKQRLVVEIKDTGVGIPAEEISHLFQPYVQAHSSTSMRYGGTGLGLSISRRLVRLMGGDIEIESKLGAGSTFRFHIDLVPSSSESEQASNQTVLNSQTPSQGRVLLIEMNGASREILERYLRSLNLQVTAAADALTGKALGEAAERSGQPFQLVLLDHNLRETFDWNHVQPVIPCILLGSQVHAARASMERSAVLNTPQESCLCILARPVRIASLRAAVLNAIDIPDGLPAAPPRNTPPVPPPVYGLAGPTEKTAEVSPSVTAQATIPEHILVVEDNAVNQKVISMMLRKLGYTTDIASNGIEALAVLQQNTYGLVMMDCQMPEMDGFTATAEIRKLEASIRALEMAPAPNSTYAANLTLGGLPPPHTPIVALTANALTGDREKCIAAGMDEYLMKPIDMLTLRKTLDQVLGNRTCPRPSKSSTSAIPTSETTAPKPS